MHTHTHTHTHMHAHTHTHTHTTELRTFGTQLERAVLEESHSPHPPPSLPVRPKLPPLPTLKPRPPSTVNCRSQSLSRASQVKRDPKSQKTKKFNTGHFERTNPPCNDSHLVQRRPHTHCTEQPCTVSNHLPRTSKRREHTNTDCLAHNVGIDFTERGPSTAFQNHPNGSAMTNSFSSPRRPIQSSVPVLSTHSCEHDQSSSMQNLCSTCNN